MAHEFFLGYKKGATTNCEMFFISPDGENFCRVSREPAYGDAEQVKRALKLAVTPKKGTRRSYLEEIGAVIVAPGTDRKLGRVARSIVAEMQAKEDMHREAAYKAAATLKARTAVEVDGYGTPKASAQDAERAALDAKRKAAGVKAAATRRSRMQQVA